MDLSSVDFVLNGKCDEDDTDDDDDDDDDDDNDDSNDDDTNDDDDTHDDDEDDGDEGDEWSSSTVLLLKFLQSVWLWPGLGLALPKYAWPRPASTY